jgi:hypothetical protein
MQDYEKLGAFYLGRRFDPDKGEVATEDILYDAKDLTTHAVCVGMTGSGKTGLAICLLEEAAIDGIPIIAIDPKGDLGNLMLTFPNLAASDFRPWIDEGAAARNGKTPEEQANWTADLWRKGLSDWGQEPSRISKFADSVERTIYTPGSESGIPVSVLRSFAAPPAGCESDVLRERILGSVSGLLTLLGVDADPLKSREHILLSTILDQSWREGRDLDIPNLIRLIQKPPFEKVGVFDLESFFPAGDRMGLAMSLNNLLASPGFSAWTEGKPLNIGKFLYGENGKPRLSIFSIAHLSDTERMFFVTLLLNEVLSWVRLQSGSQSLRAILYMDEVFGYFPPTANPPSKTPMLTLLKQARAYGLGVVLATQNPVDLDYKGLSNTGTWFLGRLQTERDKLRVIEGLEGAATATGTSFDRSRIEKILSGLGSRVFLMNNVHEDEPVLFQTRWALSYLAGPLTRQQIQMLRESGAPAVSESAPQPVGAQKEEVKVEPLPEVDSDAAEVQRPMVPSGVDERFLSEEVGKEPSGRLVYRPALYSKGSLHYSNSKAAVDFWKRVAFMAPLSEDTRDNVWEESEEVPFDEARFAESPEAGAAFASLPALATNGKAYATWEKQFKSYLYREKSLKLLRSKRFKAVSRPEESEGEFLGRLRDLAHQERDLELEKIKKKYTPKLKRLQDRIATAEDKVAREEAQYGQQKMQTAISIGSTLLGAMLGRKMTSVTNVGRATTAMRGAGRAARERGDIARAQQDLRELQRELEDLEREFQERLADLRTEFENLDPETEELNVAPRKTDLSVDPVTLVWTPWRVDANGIAERAF